MKKLLILFILFLSFFTFTETFTQTKEHPIDAWVSNCMDKDGSTMGMIKCSDSAAVLWDKELNTVYDLLQ
ncbi:MAG TPA: lysozyme inhibitor LprI family protein [Ignavibacteria bacterium]|nr:lysozyme inhibitor LprI family protein [Ignavibacteria bacterium]